MSKIDDANENHYLNEIEDGAGCVEIWERLSEVRGEGEVEADDD